MKELKPEEVDSIVEDFLDQIMPKVNTDRILKVKEMLEEEKIPFEMRKFMGGYQICYPQRENFTCSIIEHRGSYGLEISGLLTEEESEYDSVLGNLTPEEVLERVKADYDLKQKNIQNVEKENTNCNLGHNFLNDEIELKNDQIESIDKRTDINKNEQEL